MIDERGAVLEAQLLREGGAIPIPEGQLLVRWPISKSDFSFADGREVDQATFDGLSVAVIASNATVPCPCRAPGGSRPATIFPGESCAPPSFVKPEMLRRTDSGAEAANDSELLASASEAVRLSWPGECSCALEATSSQGEPKLCGLGALGPAWAFPTLAISPSGVFAAFSVDYAKLVGVDGSEQLIEADDFPTGDLVAIPGDDDSILVVGAHRPDETSELAADSYSPSATPSRRKIRAEVQTRLPEVRIQSALVHSSELLLVGSYQGTFNQRVALILSCSLEPDLLSCQEMPIERCREHADKADVSSAVALEDGSMLAVTQGGWFLKRVRGENGWSCDEEDSAIELDGKAGSIIDLRHVARVGSTLVACGRVELDGTRRIGVVTASVSALVRNGTVIAPRLSPKPVYSSGTDQCRGIWVDGERVFASFGDRIVELSPAGEFLGEFIEPGRMPDTPYETIGRRVVRGLSEGSVLLLETIDGAIFRDSGSGPERVHGRREYDESTPGLVARPDGSILIFEPLAGVYRARLEPGSMSCADISIEPIATTTRWIEPDEQLWNVVGIRGDERKFVVVVAKEGRAAARWIDLDEVEPEREVPLGELVELHSAVELGDGHILLTRQDGSLAEVGELAAREVTVDFGTGAFGASDPRSESPTWRAVDTHDGVAWATGGTSVARVRMTPTGALAEGVSLRELPGGREATGLELSAVRAGCFGAEVAGREVDQITTERAKFQQSFEIGCRPRGSPVSASCQTDLLTGTPEVRASEPLFIVGGQTNRKVLYRTFVFSPPQGIRDLPPPFVVRGVGTGNLTILAQRYGGTVAVIDRQPKD